ncbi:MAG: hypothetical protein IIB55_09970, partial [Planctomycetes bacterium]|nr:hypothetical protein [Planctomycetota bacterium]
MNDSGASEATARGEKNGGFFGKVLAPLSSVWFGVTLLSLLFVYCSIGSAVPRFRQHHLLEMTEFEWFHWWPFNLLISLLCLGLIVITIRRIPLRLVNAGVWTIHTGIIVLCIGSYVYFAAKVEGDAPVFRRRVEIMAPGMTEPLHMVALPGVQAFADIGPDRWRFRVQSTNTDWPILTEGFEGQKAYAVNIMVERPGAQPFIRQLLAGYPQFTEDIIPGQGRAIKSLGRKLVAPDLEITLGYEPTEYFHVMDTWALYARRVGEKEWVERPIHGMPRYNERIGDRSLVANSSNLPLRPLDLLVPTSGEGDPFGDATVRVTGYLPYAMMQKMWRDGGSRFNPMLGISIHAPGGAQQSSELFALDAASSEIPSGYVGFTWVPDAAALDRLPKSIGATLHVSVPATEKALEIALDEKTVVGAEGEFTRIEGTEFSYRVTAVQDNLEISGRSVSVAIVDVTSPEGPFTRWVFDDERLNRDHRPGETHGAGGGDNTSDPDPRLKMRYDPAIPPVLFVVVGDTPPALHVSAAAAGARARTIESYSLGDRIPLVQGFEVSADRLLLRARSETKPHVVAPERRHREGRGG